jgi:hypothetical protein
MKGYKVHMLRVNLVSAHILRPLCQNKPSFELV